MDAPLTPEELAETIVVAAAPAVGQLARSFARLDYEMQIATVAFRALGEQIEIARCELIVAGETRLTPLDYIGLDDAP